MNYLMRAAQRLSTVVAPKVRPAMPSRSPVAEADQRLNIDTFAARFDVAVVPEPIAPAPEENEGAAFSGSDRTIREYRAAQRPTSPGLEPAIAPSDPVVPAVQSKPQSDNAPARGEPSRAVPAQPSPPSTTHPARPREQAPARDSVSPSFPGKATVLPDQRTTPEPQTRRVKALFDSATVESRGRASDRSRMDPASAETQERVLERDRAADTVMEALNRTMLWVEGQTRRSREVGRGERARDSSSPGSQPRLGEPVQARPIREAPRDSKPITHLEIGKIEVEVVPPAKPPQNVAPARPGPKPVSSNSASRQTFGWRQR